MTVTDARERVARGAAFLDRTRPGWAQRIDTGTLTLHDPCGCIVGQLCHSGTWRFHDDIAALANMAGADDDDVEAFAIAHGFDLSEMEYGAAFFGELDDPKRVEVFAPLQSAWIEAIADRIVAGDGERASGEVQEIRLADVPLA